MTREQARIRELEGLVSAMIHARCSLLDVELNLVKQANAMLDASDPPSPRRRRRSRKTFVDKTGNLITFPQRGKS